MAAFVAHQARTSSASAASPRGAL